MRFSTGGSHYVDWVVSSEYPVRCQGEALIHKQ